MTTNKRQNNLSAMPVSLQRSSPDLPSSRSGMNGFDNMQSEPIGESMLTTRLQFSRSFTERGEKYNSAQSRKLSTNALDAKHVRIYLRRQNSRGSIQSSASTCLASGDNVSISSRPVSAESNEGARTMSNNTRIVIPNQPNRVFPPPFARSSSIPTFRQKPSYLNNLVCQVLDYLFMSGIEAAYNANLLCRLNIEYLIDISNVEPQKVPRNRRSDCPCLCPLETAHSRARMTITIEENSIIDLIPYFKDVNDFIESARACGKSVLIHSYHGRNRCAVMVLQYLIMIKRINLERAEQLIKSLWPTVSVSENFYRSLKKWESTFVVPDVEDDESSSSQSATTTSVATPFLKKSAWM